MLVKRKNSLRSYIILKQLKKKLGNNTSALFPFTDQTFNHLCTTGRRSLAYAASAIADVYLQPDQDAIYDDLIEVKLDDLQPYVHGPFTASRLTRLNKLKDTVLNEEWPDELSAISISITDKTMLDRVARIAKQARQRGLEVRIPFRILINDTIVPNNEDRALLAYLFKSVGAKIVSQPSKMVGHGISKDMDDSKWISVLATSCANVFDEELRYMGNPNSHAFVASPEVDKHLGKEVGCEKKKTKNSKTTSSMLLMIVSSLSLYIYMYTFFRS